MWVAGITRKKIIKVGKAPATEQDPCQGRAMQDPCHISIEKLARLLHVKVGIVIFFEYTTV